MTFFVLAILFLIAFLFFDYFKNYKRERVMERLDYGFDLEDEEVPSLWDGAKDLLQLSAIRQLLLQSAIIRALDLHMRRAQLKLSLLQGISFFSLTVAMIVTACYFSFDSHTPAIAAVVVTPLFLWSMLKYFSQRQQRLMDLQLPSLINSMLTTMRAGGTPIQALHATARNAANPMKDSITQVLNQLQLGQSPISVWKEWSDFWDTKSCRLLSTGIRVKWEAGGQMSSVLEHILETIEFRKKIEERINTLTTQAKLGSIVLSLIPPLLVLMQYRVTPDLVMEMFNDETGQKIYMFAGGLTLVGFFWLRKMAKIKLE